MKRFLCVILTLTLVLSSALSLTAVFADESACTLTQTVGTVSKTGTNSEFVLKTASAVKIEDAEKIKISDASVALDIKAKSDTEFLITPTDELKNNKVYMFTLELGGKEYRWAFQTEKGFNAVSTYPSNEAYDVPVNTGIEVTLSEEGFTGDGEDKYFSIEPAVSGRYEIHGATVSFVPDSPLEYDTAYTVSVSDKLTSADGKKLKPFTFAFTTVSQQTETDKDKVGMSISDFERFALSEKPEISLSVYSRAHDKYNITYELFKVNDFDSALGLVRKRLPYGYSYIRNSERYSDIDVSGFDKLAAYTKTLTSDEAGYFNLEFGRNLGDGYYVVRAECKNAAPVWTVFQMTDIGANIFTAGEKSVVWVNDIKKSAPVPGAEVMYDGGEAVKTDSAGIAYMESCTDEKKLVTVKAAGKSPIVLYAPYRGYRYYDAPGGTNTYWSVIQTDRDIFKNNDTVNIWGFISKRDGSPLPEKLTLSVSEAYRGDSAIIKKIIKPDDGIFESAVSLEDFDDGYYHVSVSDGERTVCQSGFSVENFIKPEYKMTASVYPRAVFDGEKVTFKVNTAFYDGTPLSNTDISYRVSYENGRINENAKTDIKGNMSIDYTPEYCEGMQGIAGIYFDAETTLPNAGQLGAYEYASVALNDIVCDTDASRKGKTATVSAQVNKADLSDARESGNTSYDNIKGAPVSDKEINVDIYKEYYEAKETGTYYDYIEKRTVKTYSYTEKKEKIKTFKLKTDSDGKAEKKFDIPTDKHTWYYAAISLKDSNGRVMTYRRGIGEEYVFKYESGKYFDLKRDKEKYDVGEIPVVNVTYGEEAPVNTKTMFIRAKTGIDDVIVSKDNTYKFLFDDKNVPNCRVYAIALSADGYHYLGSRSIGLDYEKRKLNVKINTDKASYAPGDSCTVSVEVTDAKSKGRAANINISLVDKALLDISGYTPDTLNDLYTGVYPEFSGNVNTSEDLLRRGSGATGGAMKNSQLAADSVEKSESYASESENGSGSAPVREDFKDTAVFASLKTDENGKVSYTFTLPDNITSWRVYTSAVTADYYAGNASFDVSSGLPMFISHTLSDTFLTGDVPSIGVNAYGTALKDGESITFKATDPENPAHETEVHAKAFERVNIPLWEITDTGEHSVIISAVSESGISDSIRCKYTAVDSYRTYTYSDFKELNPSDALTADGAKSMVRIRFTDGERGRIISGLMNLIWQCGGDRVEKKIVKSAAQPIIDKYFGEQPEGVDMSFADYINPDGGVAMLPEAASDPEVTALALNFISADKLGSEENVKKYLYSVYGGDNSENKIAALYGLALLGEPVMDEVEKYSLIDALSIRETAYIGLCFASYGNTDAAERCFEKIKAKTVNYDPYLYVDESDKDKSIASTSAALLLACKIGAPEADGYYRYTRENYTSETLKVIEELSYLTEKFAKLPEDDAALTYTLWGEEKTVDFKTGENAFVTLSQPGLSDLKITSASGGAGAVMMYQKSISDITDSNDNITVKRRFYKVGAEDAPTNEFKAGDIIRVNLWIEYGNKALDGAYSISEYLPSGLEYVTDSAKIPYTSIFESDKGRFIYPFVSGKKITFYDYNFKGIGCSESGGKLYYYYARVTSPGKYRAEGTTVCKIGAKNTLTFGADDYITISE